MNWHKWVRHVHRWVSIVFTVVVAAIVLAAVAGIRADWLGYLAVIPLAFLLPTGLYLFVLPYAVKRRGDAHTLPSET